MCNKVKLFCFFCATETLLITYLLNYIFRTGAERQKEASMDKFYPYGHLKARHILQLTYFWNTNSLFKILCVIYRQLYICDNLGRLEKLIHLKIVFVFFKQPLSAFHCRTSSAVQTNMAQYSRAGSTVGQSQVSK